ncbi:hypothetical protein MAPG_09558 [Magnaporthiopsis poae ATCC 64411]|uniref:Chromosome segregation protein BIR1 n=1 Tax=Magnaporthiopsis poae (strain ATCC 64411 / 73-15) TaxID=644358 RepID=A0A0C4EA98_MAGP6|nr:hypothetical protein MAPG_09558 [Magnaporthiopsis poae ATCC 64411]
MDDRYLVYENRLSSFLGPQAVTKQRRASNSSSRTPKTLSWPHKFLPPFELAKAGFYFDPHPGNPDNVVCFLCNKNMDGWEADDSPVEEHLKHSPDCGWAVTAAVEAECQGLEQVDPRDPRMVEARKATFAGKWPYESKKGWKCKTKQLAEAGWIYTPTNESDDNTTCAYCQLSLDGWEAADKPMDEHFKRASGCPFFELINKKPAPPKRVPKSRLPRGSKVSRVSTQSAVTAASDVTSVADIAADHEDSVMTMSSVVTTASKKTTRTRKAPASKGRKTKAKKDEPVEIHEDADTHDADMPPPPPPKPARGRKRASDAVEDPVLTNAEAPAPKKRATKTRGSQNPDASVVTIASQADVEMVDADVRPKAAATKKRAGTTAKTKSRKASATSVVSTTSAVSLHNDEMVDAEIDRQLQADLDRPMTDEEELAGDSGSESKKAPAAAPKARGKKATAKKAPVRKSQDEANADYAMFDPAPAEPNDESVDAELEALETEVSAATQSQELAVPKKGRKPAVRKVSKQVKKAKQPEPRPEPEPEMEIEPEVEQPEAAREPTVAADQHDDDAEVEVFHDASEVHESSTATVVQHEAPAPKRGRGRPKKSTVSRASTSSQQSRLSTAPTPEPKRPSLATAEPSRTPEPETAKGSATAAASKPLAATAPVAVSPPPAQKSMPVPPLSESRHFPPPPATPSAKQAALSPSQSPQSSDAENQPPSSRPAAGAVMKKVVLAPSSTKQHHHYDVTSTPVRGGTPSPSKRLQGNPRTIGGLQSTTPWTEVDLDLVFAEHGLDGDERDANKENGVGGLDSAAARFVAKGSDLTSPEKRMTVEEWIYYNAGQAEKRLRQECEALVSSFEREGSRAMRVLEEIVVEP